MLSCSPGTPATFTTLRPSFVVVLAVATLFALAPTASAQTPDPPPRSDTITAVSQFLACSGNAYALCYYSGPPTIPTGTVMPVPALPCELDKHGKFADCKCYAIEDPSSTNYVALPSILNPKIRDETEAACGEDGKRCLNMENQERCSENPGSEGCKTAPVCGYLGNIASGQGQTFYPDGGLISTFSFKNAERYPISSTDCSEEPYIAYAGCMTASCGKPYSEKGEDFVDCSCPTYVGPFQFGQTIPDVSCNLGPENVWSAANTTVSLPTPPASSDEN